MQGNEFEADVSIGTEIPDQEHVDDYQIHDHLLEDSNQHIREEDQSPSSVRFHAQDESGKYMHISSFNFKPFSNTLSTLRTEKEPHQLSAFKI